MTTIIVIESITPQVGVELDDVRHAAHTGLGSDALALVYVEIDALAQVRVVLQALALQATKTCAEEA